MFSNKLFIYAVITLCLMQCLGTDAIIPKKPEEYKKYFGRKLRKSINAQMVAFVQHISPDWTHYIKSVIADLPAKDEHTQKLQYYLDVRDNLLNDVKKQNGKKRKISLIKAMKKYIKCFDTIKDVNEICTAAVKPSDFRKILTKHDLGKMERKLTEELITYMKNIYREWMILYAAIPEPFLKQYPQFKQIDESWQKMINRADFKEKSKLLLKVDDQISKFFGYDNFLKVYF